MPWPTASAVVRAARPLLLVLALCAARAHALTVEELQYILTVFGVVAGSVCFVLCLIDAGWARQKEVSHTFGCKGLVPLDNNSFVSLRCGRSTQQRSNLESIGHNASRSYS